jgi:hypothetical protein
VLQLFSTTHEANHTSLFPELHVCGGVPGAAGHHIDLSKPKTQQKLSAIFELLAQVSKHDRQHRTGTTPKTLQSATKHEGARQLAPSKSSTLPHNPTRHASPEEIHEVSNGEGQSSADIAEQPHSTAAHPSDKLTHAQSRTHDFQLAAREAFLVEANLSSL